MTAIILWTFVWPWKEERVLNEGKIISGRIGVEQRTKRYILNIVSKLFIKEFVAFVLPFPPITFFERSVVILTF